ncbi:dynein axonemal heavy chain 9-like isoform X2 [Manis javanica]|uniref:dynein axonemal heavy chain 9-like isoform X2 n=1 Tax=Manis javanica TaxID=9974 RepID=UPI003C6CF0BD
MSLQDLLNTTLDFHKLGKLEFSGIRGKALSQQIQQMYEEFQEMYRVFSESSYDCLDPQSTEFENDVSEFKQRVDLNQRLGNIFIQAFDDTPSLEHAFKLIDIAGKLLERTPVAQDVADKYLVLIQMFNKDLNAVRIIYSQRVQEEAEFDIRMKSVQRFIVVPALKLRYETSLYDDWCQTVSEKSQYNLSQPLLQRDPEMKQITVNFNPQGILSAACG